MVKLIAGILSSPVLNSINFPSSSNSKYSKFKRLCKSIVSNPNVKCLAAIGYFESVNSVCSVRGFKNIFPPFYF